MPLKVLVANENTMQNSLYCAYLSNDKDLEILSTKDGSSTLNTYIKIRPSILILDSIFSDLKYTDILNKLTNLDDEKMKCNTIITINNVKEQLLLENAQKVHSIFQKPINFEKLSQTLNLMKKEIKYKEINPEELDLLLFKLNLNIGSNGYNYLRTAIFYCYYNLDAFKSLDGIYDFVASQYNVDIKTVKSGIRGALIPLNNNYQPDSTHHNKLYNIFDKSRKIITPKYFLEAFVTYLHYIKNKK